MAQPSPSPSPHRSPPRAAPEDPPLTPTPAQEERAAAAADDWQEEQMPPTPPHSTDVVVSAAAAKYVPPRAATHIAADAGAWYSWTGRAPRPSRASQSERARPPPLPPQQQPWEEQAPPPPPRQQPWEEAPPPPPRRTKNRPQPQPKPQPRQELPPHPPPAAAPPRVAAPPSPAPMPRAPLPAPSPAPISSAERDRRVVPDILSRKRRAAVLQRSALVARGAAAGLCLAALAVLAADTRKGWALDSYSRYTQLRYSEAVNVIGFLYSLFQFVALAELMRRNKHLIPRPKGDYFDFFMDQVLAYLLISSSSSATARTGDWIDNWGSDPFPTMANSSIAISFLAFLVFAINALISAYNLFRRDL